MKARTQAGTSLQWMLISMDADNQTLPQRLHSKRPPTKNTQETSCFANYQTDASASS
jgi:hypothetical protein